MVWAKHVGRVLPAAHEPHVEHPEVARVLIRPSACSTRGRGQVVSYDHSVRETQQGMTMPVVVTAGEPLGRWHLSGVHKPHQADERRVRAVAAVEQEVRLGGIDRRRDPSRSDVVRAHSMDVRNDHAKAAGRRLRGRSELSGVAPRRSQITGQSSAIRTRERPLHGRVEGLLVHHLLIGHVGHRQRVVRRAPPPPVVAPLRAAGSNLERRWSTCRALQPRRRLQPTLLAIKHPSAASPTPSRLAVTPVLRTVVGNAIVGHVTKGAGLVRVGCTLAVLAVATGLLGMHGLTIGTSVSPESPVAPGVQHLAHLPTLAAAELAAVRVDASMPAMEGHGHELAACMWVLVGAIGIALLGGASLGNISGRAGLAFPRALFSAGQRSSEFETVELGWSVETLRRRAGVPRATSIPLHPHRNPCGSTERLSMRRSIAITALLLVGSLLLAACGSSGDSSSNSMGMSDQSGMHDGSNGMEANNPVAAGAREIPVEAGALTFTPKRLQLTAGEDVTIVLTSIDIAHDFYVDGVGHVVHAGHGRPPRAVS